MGNIDTTDFQSRVADVILPCQSYLSEVTDSLALCCTEASLDKFSLLSASFGQSGFSADYDPWTYVATFGRSVIYKSLVSSHRSVSSGTEVRSKCAVAADTSSVKLCICIYVQSNCKPCHFPVLLICLYYSFLSLAFLDPIFILL